MIDWREVHTSDVWYTIGYITADGNLSSDGRHINITSKDISHLRKIKRCLKLTNKLSRKSRSRGMEKKYGVLQFGDVKFYKFLLSIGLIPRKSLTLDALRVPHEFFIDFLRGVIDGDGNIRTWIHPQNDAEQWELRIFSAAPGFAKWLHGKIEDYFQVTGALMMQKAKLSRSPVFIIKFGKMAARRILSECYYQEATALYRKARLARLCIRSYPGWTSSLTVK